MYYTKEQLLSAKDVEELENTIVDDEGFITEEVIMESIRELLNTEEFVNRLRSKNIPESHILAIVSSAYIEY